MTGPILGLQIQRRLAHTHFHNPHWHIRCPSLEIRALCMLCLESQEAHVSCAIYIDEHDNHGAVTNGLACRLLVVKTL